MNDASQSQRISIYQLKLKRFNCQRTKQSQSNHNEQMIKGNRVNDETTPRLIRYWKKQGINTQYLQTIVSTSESNVQ